jgi:hypothetical protein
MDFVDPKLRGLKILLDDAANAMNWLARHTVGTAHAPSMKPHVNDHLADIADYLDEKFGEIVVNSVISGGAIDRGADVVFAVIARNPKLAPMMPFKNMFKDLLKVAFSMSYRGRSFGDAITDRALSRYTGLHIPGWEPMFKSAAGAMVAESLRAEHMGE